ncbi:hypothetical protein IDVR_06140 [Intrasporangium sp. DVR]
MPLGALTRAQFLRATAVATITGSIWAAAACSDEDVVDTIPPPRPNRTSTSTTSTPTTGTVPTGSPGTATATLQ